MLGATNKRNSSLSRYSTPGTIYGSEEETESDLFAVGYENNEENYENIEFNKFLKHVKLDVLQKEMEKAGSAHGLNQYIRDSLDAWKDMELNVAVTGNSGVGKSSLINSLRNLKPSDRGAAPVGVVEITSKCQRYTYPENEHVVLWDLPGIGTQTFTKDKYLRDMDFSRFDVVIIVCARRFLENDIWLGKELLELQKNILFVRTQIDIDISNDKQDHPEDFNKANCIAKIRRNLIKNIRIGRIPTLVSGIYLVSSRDRELYDFAKFDENLKCLLSIKGKAISKSLEKHVMQAIRADQAFYKEEFKFQKVVSVIYGFLPLPFLETGLGNMSVSLMRKRCMKKFCIDDSSLDKIAAELDCTKYSLKSRLKSYIIDEEGPLLASTEKKRWSRFRQYLKYIIPVVGSFVSAHKTYLTLQDCLETMCGEMSEDEQELVRMRLDMLEAELQPL